MKTKQTRRNTNAVLVLRNTDTLFQKTDPGRASFDSVQLLDPERKIAGMIMEMPLGKSNSKNSSVSNTFYK